MQKLTSALLVLALLACSKEDNVKLNRQATSASVAAPAKAVEKQVPLPVKPVNTVLENKIRDIVKTGHVRQKCNNLNGCAMVEELALLGPVAAPTLQSIYESSKGDGFWRFRLLEAIGRCGNRKMGDFLLGVLQNDRYENARIQAALAIARLSLRVHLDELKVLLQSLTPPRDRGVLLAIGYALARLGDPDGQRLIDEHLVVPEHTLRWDRLRPGVFAAGKLRLKHLRKRIEIIAIRADPFVRREAVIALKNMRDKMAIPTLLKALKDRVPGVRKEAQSALVALTGYRHKSTYEHWNRWWQKEQAKPPKDKAKTK